jgi:membrane protease YdiL (CAAX protease family)
MLPEKPWKVEAILRLFARVVICIFMGTLASSTLGVLLGPQRTHATGFLISAGCALGLFIGALAVLGRPWRLESFGRDSLVLLFCFYGGLCLVWWSVRLHPNLAALEHSAVEVLIAVLGFQGAALVLVHWFLREYGSGWGEAFGFSLQGSRALLLGTVFALLFLPIGWALQSASSKVLEHFHVLADEQQAVQVLRATEAWGGRILLGIGAVLIAPAGEEVLFRGILYPAIRQRGFPRLALWGTSLLFGAIHFNLATFLPLTVLALVLIWLYEKTENLLAPIAAHTVFNAMNFAVLYLGEWSNRLPVNS